MADHLRISVEDVTQHFVGLEDPRSQINQRHPLVSVVVIALMAVLSEANGPTAIAAWANDKKDFLLSLLPLPNGIPQKDVYRRVLAALNPAAFQACFANWLRSLRIKAAETSGVEQPVFAVDGKTVRRSHDRRNGLGALHSVSVWATEFGLTLGQVATDEKSNEITAIPELLRLVDIKGAIITIDAMGTQKAIAQQIVDAEADYVLGLKGNQDSVHKAVAAYVDEQWENDFADVDARQDPNRRFETARALGRYADVPQLEPSPGHPRRSSVPRVPQPVAGVRPPWRDGSRAPPPER